MRLWDCMIDKILMMGKGVVLEFGERSLGFGLLWVRSFYAGGLGCVDFMEE